MGNGGFSVGEEGMGNGRGKGVMDASEGGGIKE